MRNSEHCAFFEFVSNDSLNDRVIFHIDICCGLVNKHDFTPFQEGSANAEKLFLSCRQTTI
jgi:hypothetical protein